MMKSHFLQRTVTGVLFVGVLVGCTLFSPISFSLLFTLISALAVFEFTGLVNKHTESSVNRAICSLGAAYLYLAFMAFCTDITNTGVFLPYLLLLIYMMLSELWLKKSNPLGNWACSVLSQVYIGLPFALLNVLAFQQDMAGSAVSYNPILPLSVFVFLWMSDSGAYCVGSLMGKHKLFERISPKKTWEGSVGGGLLAVAASLALGCFFPIMNIWQWMGLAVVVAVMGNLGDLMESLLKRQIDIKDSGNILPGHGGLLDRFDSSLMAIPAATAYLYLLSL